MMTYRDMTFCDADWCSKFKTCDRALTEDVKQKASEWWGDDPGSPPICIYMDTPECFESKGGPNVSMEVG